MVISHPFLALGEALMRGFKHQWRIPMRLVSAIAVLAAAVSAVPHAGPPGLEPAGEHYQAARGAITKGDTDEAILELRLALQDNPLDASSHHLLGCLLAQQGEEEQSIVAFHHALAIDPTHPEGLHNLGTMLLQRGEAVLAARMLERAVEIRPDDVRSYNSLAKAYFLVGLPQLAVATYQEALRRDPSNPVALKNLALLGQDAGGDEPDAGREEPGQTPGAGPDGPEVSEPPEQSREQDQAAEPDADRDDAEPLQELLSDLPYVSVERRGSRLTLNGWTRGAWERELLKRILGDWPDVLDLTSDDVGDPQRMLEVDAILFLVIGVENRRAGFNFLDLVKTSFTYFSADHSSSGTGFVAPGTIGAVGDLARQGWLFVASVDYAVNIANAADDHVAVLARPHLTTLSGTPAKFLAGGELVFKVSGINSGDIKPYPFGTSLTVTPTLLRTPGENGDPRVHIAVEAGRTSILALLTADPSESVAFDKLTVSSEAVLGMGQTLILSGLNQREMRSGRSGVPGLRSIPLLKYLFSTKTTVEVDTAVIVLLTPRDPAFWDEKNRASLAEFVDMRRAFVQARQGGEEDLQRFRERYPKWNRIPPNRFASHFFLSERSDLYRAVSGDDLVDESLDLDLLGDPPKDGKKKKKSAKAAD